MRDEERHEVLAKLYLTDAERALMVKLAKNSGESIGGYLRTVMLTDGVMLLDQEAIRLAKRHAGEKLARRIARLLGVDIEDAPVKARA